MASIVSHMPISRAKFVYPKSSQIYAPACWKFSLRDILLNTKPLSMSCGLDGDLASINLMILGSKFL